MKRSYLLLAAVFIFIVLAVFLSNQPIKNPAQNNQSSQKQVLEQFLQKNNAPPNVAEAYRFALENPQNVLSQVNCYCGCIINQGHKNNRDCFIKDDNTFDLMGLNCGLCVKTALTAKQMLSEGKSVSEISKYVDSKWGNN